MKDAFAADYAEKTLMKTDQIKKFRGKEVARVFLISLLAFVSVASACWSTPEPVNKATPTPSAHSNTVVAAPGQTVQPMPTIDLPAATSNRELSGDTIAERANRRSNA